ncbi:serine/threonine dehydratase [Streptomyces sp. AC563]|uniref:serine/threonine dehydratase n=1 Tax=Streptomyces buecherae TaxID=2763006 RepID=UPI00164EB502|nr:serine/threonine dehydratase [Streptomyces buecherae]MBC3985794.1 serine/threonine dehydratase [Streptomyces buecherae]MBC3992202.1 serine/threonine dehydratase [Streptomyces buecherae]QNJ42592.1 serine/threonine dehydratase [Streptomyces buecherae]
MTAIVTYEDVQAAAERIAGHTRPVAVARADTDVWFALEYLQHTGSFKARGAANFVAAHALAGTMPEAGVVIASGGNAGLAIAWAAARHGVPATVFTPATSPAVKVDRIRALGADTRLVGTEYDQALAASREHADATGALLSHAYDHPLVAAGAGTLFEEIHRARPGLDTVLVACGGGGLFAGVAAAAHARGVRVVAVEPVGCPTLHAAIEAGEPVEVGVDSIAADALGARFVTPAALHWARESDASVLLVPDAAITAARRALWEERRIVVENAAAAGYAALHSGAYQPAPGERVCAVLCGANTDPADLVARA